MTDEITPVSAELVPVNDTSGVAGQVTAFKARSQLNEVQLQTAHQLASRLNTDNSMDIVNFGAEAQRGLNQVTQPVLEHVRSKDVGFAGQSLSNLIDQTKSLDPKSLLGGGGIFGRLKNRVKSFIRQYESVEKQIKEIEHLVEGQQRTLARDIQTFDQLKVANATQREQLFIYIAAGKEKIQELRNQHRDLATRAQQSGDIGLAEDAQDLDAKITLLEQRVYNLIIATQVSYQNNAQLRLLQQGDQSLILRMQETLNLTIPMWRAQVVTVIGIYDQQKGAELLAKVSETTNQMLTQNAALLRQSAGNVAKQANKGIVEIQTLEQSQQQLIATLEDVQRINEEGRAAREAGEQRIQELENELTNRLAAIQPGNHAQLPQ